jgi:hypothetical protein
MMDKELIAMCDTPEIQDRWEPKVGDRVWSKLHECYATIVELEGNGIMHLRADDGSMIWRVMKDEVIYIPRIEDVLEWLKGYEIAVDICPDGMWEVTHVHDAFINLIPVKPLLRLYMKSEHNKTWNGEAWV